MKGNLLKGTSGQTLNPYEVMYDKLSQKPLFVQEDWVRAAKEGSLDAYSTALLNSDKVNVDEFAQLTSFVDSRTRMSALYNEVGSDRTELKKQKRNVYDENGNAVTTPDGKPVIEEFEATDYEFTKQLIKTRNEYLKGEHLKKVDEELKASRDGLEKFLLNVASVPTGITYGFIKGVNDLGSIVTGVGNMISDDNKSTSTADDFIAGLDKGRFLQFAEDGIKDFESRYTSMRDADGNYTNLGKYVGGISSTLGQLLPSMLIGKGAGTAAGALGASAKTASTIASASSQLLFYAGMTAGNIRDMHHQFAMSGVSVTSASIIANASIKSALQWAVEIGLGKLLGGSAIDNVVFGRGLGKTTLSAGKRIGKDFVTEGLEEVFQDTSDFLVDRAFMQLINENYGSVTELTWQSLMDAFIIGGFASIAGSAGKIVGTKKVQTLVEKRLKDGTIKLDENNNPIFTKLNKIQSWEYGLNMQSFMENYNEVTAMITKLDAKKDAELSTAVTELYASYRIIASIYGEIGKERFEAADTILTEITKSITDGSYKVDDLVEATKLITTSFKDLQGITQKDAIEAVKNARIRELKAEIIKGKEVETPINEDTKAKIDEILKNPTIEKVAIAGEGNNTVVIDDTVIIPEKLIENNTVETVKASISETKLIKLITSGKYKVGVLDKIVSTYNNYCGKKSSAKQAVTALLFDDSFFTIMLVEADRDVYQFLTSLNTMITNITSDSKISDIDLKKKIETTLESKKGILIEYAMYTDADYNSFIEIFKPEERQAIIRKIEAARWSKNLYTRVILGDKLSDSDINILKQRINNVTGLTLAYKEQLLKTLTDDKATRSSREAGMRTLMSQREYLFNSKYDGKNRMPLRGVGNTVFNNFLDLHGLTVETFTDVKYLTEADVSIIGTVTAESVLKYRQEQFARYNDNRFTVSQMVNNKGDLVTKIYDANTLVGYSDYATQLKLVQSGKPIEGFERTNVTKDYKRNDLVRNIIMPDIDIATSSYLSINDVITDPSLLNENMQLEIIGKYGDLSPDSAFMYLRSYFANTMDNITIILLQDGTYAFGNVKPMTSLLKSKNITITRDTKIKDLIKDEYLIGMLKDIELVFTNKITDAASYSLYKNVQDGQRQNVVIDNKIYVSTSLLQDQAYLKFAILHEFQHAVQSMNKMNTGLDAKWTRYFKPATIKAIVTEVENHSPELFIKAKNYADKVNIVEKYVYNSSGESTAMGMDSSPLINFYPTLVYFKNNAVHIQLSSGGNYSTNDTTLLQSLVIDKLNGEVYKILEESEYQEFFEKFEEIKKHPLIGAKAIQAYDRKKTFEKKVYNNRHVVDWVAAPLGTEHLRSGILKKNLLDEIKNGPDLKDQMLNYWYNAVNLPDVSYDDFLEMDIPYVRLQSNSNINNDHFVSAYTGTNVQTLVDDVVLFLNSEDINYYDKEYTLFVGTVKPKDSIGYLGTILNEVLLPTDMVKNSKKYTITMAHSMIATVQPASSIIEKSIRQTVNEYTGEIMTMFDTFSDIYSNAPIWQKRRPYNVKLQSALQNLSKFETDDTKQWTYGMPFQDFVSLNNKISPEYKLASLRVLYEVLHYEGSFESFMKQDLVVARFVNWLDDDKYKKYIPVIVAPLDDVYKIVSTYINPEIENGILKLATVKVSDLEAYLYNEKSEAIVKQNDLKNISTYEYSNFSVGKQYDLKTTSTYEYSNFSVVDKYATELGPVMRMSLAKPESENESKPKRQVSKKMYQGTNLEYFKKPGKRLQMSEALQTFILNAKGDKKVVKQLQDRIDGNKKGTLTARHVLDYFRNAKKIDQVTFTAINNAFFKNEVIKSFEDLNILALSKTPQYYGVYETIKNSNLIDKLELFDNLDTIEKLITIINKDPVLNQLYEGYVVKYQTSGKNTIEISDKNLRSLWMQYFDGSLKTAGYIGNIARVGAILHWKITGEGNTKVKVSLDASAGRGKEGDSVGTYGDLLEDKSAREAVTEIVHSMDRYEKQELLIQHLIKQMGIQLKSSGVDYTSTKKKIFGEIEAINNMTDKQFDEEFIKYAPKIGDPVLEELVAAIILSEASGVDLLDENNVSEKDLDKITNNLVRTSYQMVSNIKSMSRTINKNISDLQKKLFLEVNGDLFDENLQVKPDLYRDVSSTGVIRLKDANIVSDIEQRVRELSKDVRNQVYVNKRSYNAKVKLDNELNKLRNELKNTIKNEGKSTVKEKIVVMDIRGEDITVKTDKEIPYVIQQLLSTELKTTEKSTTKYLTSDTDVHIRMNLKTFIETNADLLNNLTQAEVDQVIDFYMTSEIIPSTNRAKLYSSVQVLMLAYLIHLNAKNNIHLTAEQLTMVENRLELMSSFGATTLSVWKTAMKYVKPEEVLMQSLAKRSGIDFTTTEMKPLVERLIVAVQSGDKERITKAKQEVYEQARIQHIGSKKQFLDNVLQFERVAMLSGPGTWIRNISSNIAVTGLNKSSEKVGEAVVKMLNKFIPASKKWHKQGQYQIIGTKVTNEVMTFLNQHFMGKDKNGKPSIEHSDFFKMIEDGLNKYDTRKSGDFTPEINIVNLITKSIDAEIRHKFVTKNDFINDAYGLVYKMLSDAKSVRRATIRYFGKILTESKCDLSKGVTTEVLNLFSEAYTLASMDYMHKTNFFNDLELRLKQKLGNTAYFMYKQIFPFAAASWNWFAEGLKYNPLGLTKAIINFAKLENTIETLEYKRRHGEQIYDSAFAEYIAKRDIGKGVIGSVGLLIGVLLSALGVAGIDEEDDTYKLRVGDVYVDISNLFGTQGILLGISTASHFKNGDNFIDITSATLNTMFLDSSFADLFNTFRYNKTFGDWVTYLPYNMLNMMIPNLLKTITSVSSTYKVHYSKGIQGKIDKLIVQSVPFISYAYPHYTDPYTGEKQVTFNAPILTNAINKLSPIKIQHYNVSEVEKLALSLGIRKTQLLGRYDINGENVNLKASEVELLNEYYGKLNKKDFDAWTKGITSYKVQKKDGSYATLKYNKMSDEDKAVVIKRIMSNNSTLAKTYILTKTGRYKYFTNSKEFKQLKSAGFENIYLENKLYRDFVKN